MSFAPFQKTNRSQKKHASFSINLEINDWVGAAKWFRAQASWISKHIEDMYTTWKSQNVEATTWSEVRRLAGAVLRELEDLQTK